MFTNARAIDSPRGGGTHGHVAILFSDDKYLARAGEPFIIPVRPGPPAPVAAVGSTAALIAEEIRAYNQTLEDATLYDRLRAAHKA